MAKELNDDQQLLRVAVIDVGGDQEAPEALLDLLVVKLSGKPGIALLERQQINTLLREQQRNLAFSGDRSQDDIVETGRLLGADALVLVSAEPPNDKGLQLIEARIVESRRGIRFGETVLAWSEDEQAISQQVKSATERLAGLLHRVKNAKGKLTVVSIAGFRSNDLSQEAHRFRQNIESWLASQPGIAVAERTEVLPLIDERKPLPRLFADNMLINQ